MKYLLLLFVLVNDPTTVLVRTHEYKDATQCERDAQAINGVIAENMSLDMEADSWYKVEDINIPLKLVAAQCGGA